MKPEGPAHDVLERNLQQLFARAYEPVQPSAEFRVRLRHALENRTARPETARVGTFWRVAAAVLVLLGGVLLGWTMLHRSTAPVDVERLLADGRAALREAPAGPWRPLTDDEIEHGVVLAAEPIEIATPIHASAPPVRIGIEPEGGIEAGPGSRFTVRRPDRDSRVVGLALEDGALALDRRDVPGAWRIATSEGALRLSNGRLEIACLDLAPDRKVRAKLLSGSAEIETEPAFPLPTGREVLLAGGIVLGEPKLDPPAAPPERASVTGTATPDGPDAPDTSATPVDPPAVATLRGTLVGPEGTALPKAFVVTLLHGERLPRVSEPFSKTFSDEAHGFAFEGLRPGTWSVFVTVPGHATWVTSGVELSAGGTVELRCELEAGVALRGRVLDADGRPVEGALVLAEEDTPVQVLHFAIADPPAGCSAAARSDAEGVFELPHLRPGRKTLRATRAGFGAGWSQPMAPALVDPADPGSGAVIRLTRASAIEGRVAHDDGTPWPAAQVIAAFFDMSLQRPCMSFGHATAGPDGRFAIEDLPPGFYVVFNASEASGSGGSASPRIVQARVEPGARTKVDLPSNLQGTAVEGRVVSASGEPMQGLDVTLVSCERGDQDWKAVRSGADGTFRFPGLAPGAYDVFVGQELGAQYIRQDRIEVPAVPIFRPTITVASGSLRGRVTAAATGEGLPKSILIVENELPSSVEFVGKTQSDAQGRYEFRLLPAGHYRVTAYATSGRFGQESRLDIVVPEDAAGRTVDFALDPGAELSIRVTDASGRAVRGAAIRFTPVSGSSVSFSADDATDANGVYQVLGMKPGRWTVNVSHEPEGSAHDTIELSAGEERTLSIELERNH